MDRNKYEVKYFQENVLMSIVGPLKDEAAFEGKLMIIEEFHGPVIEWHPVKLQTSKHKNSPEIDSLEWEDVTSSVGFKANHDDSLGAVEIKSNVRTPNVIKFDIADLKSYKRTDFLHESKTVLTFLLKDGTNVPALQFESAILGTFLSALDNYIVFKRSKKDANLYLITDPKAEALETSFSELDLFGDSKPHIITKIIQEPYNTALGSFSRVTNFLFDYLVYHGSGSESSSQCPDEEISEMINTNILNVNIDHQEEPGYELITRIELPPRPDVKRSEPITMEEWLSFIDSEGVIKDVVEIKNRIFKGGLVHSVRSEGWKYLLGYYDFKSTNREKLARKKKRNEDYYRMKLQWKTITSDQESRFSALRDRKSLIEKDVSRTDRTHPFFEGENNINIQMLQDILMTYCMYNFDLGYVQGMSDLLSPILVVMQNEPDAFWCFAVWLKTVGANFELEQNGMKNQLQDLHRLLHFVDTQLCSYLEKHDSGNLYFVFRWLLILFKRDFKFQEIMRLWEVLWTGLPCKNFHLLLCVAILDSEKMTIMENDYGLTEILKHVNEMSYKINLEETLCKAEGIFWQIKNSKYRSDTVQAILGIEPEEIEPSLPSAPPKQPAKTEASSSVSSSSRKGRQTAKSSQSETSSSDNIDDYVDLERHYPLPFDLFP